MPFPFGDPPNASTTSSSVISLASSIVFPLANSVNILLVEIAPGHPYDRKAISATRFSLTEIQSFIWSPHDGSPTKANPSVSPPFELSHVAWVAKMFNHQVIVEQHRAFWLRGILRINGHVPGFLGPVNL